MNTDHLRYLACPGCHGQLTLTADNLVEGRVETGQLGCARCEATYPVIRFIPRFVDSNNYAGNFGLEWKKHARTQHDSYSGASISETRFFEETRWPRDLAGEVLLEVGSGSGRFTVHAASTGAMVISLDYSDAVEANYATNGGKENVLIVQGSVYEMPVRLNFFDRLFCLGVIQHTPDVEEAFKALPQFVREGGELVVDVYRKVEGPAGLLQTKHWVRPLTRRMNPALLYRLTSAYVRFMWPITGVIGRVPGGRRLNWKLLVEREWFTYDGYTLPQGNTAE